MMMFRAGQQEGWVADDDVWRRATGGWVANDDVWRRATGRLGGL